MAVLHLLTVA